MVAVVLVVVVHPVAADLPVVLSFRLVVLLVSEVAVAVVPVVVVVLLPVPAAWVVVVCFYVVGLRLSEEAVAVMPVVLLPVAADWAVVLSL